ncbi:ficolin-2-like [Physella acuta]|uniref:ficolin-2-like n=1 Tax=Physella acuta TaxID=109671 RepID=UPI0027DE7DD6|nr:ficolin-2-like [Physella acuta]
MALFTMENYATISVLMILKVAAVYSLDIMTSVYHVYNQSEVLMLPLGKQFTNRNLAYCASSGLIPYSNTVTSNNTKIYSIGLTCNGSLGVNQQMSNTFNDPKCPVNYVKVGSNPTFDPLNSNVYKSCRDVFSDESRKVVTLTSGLVVMCDTVTDGGGWTIFQRRVSGTVDFYRGWEEYKHGFGDYGIGEFYLGNENIFRISSKVAHEFRVDLIYNGNFFAKYSSFKLSNESLGYKLSISVYTGNAGDSLAGENNNLFTTFDRDNDDYHTNCAVLYIGAWWYYDCHDSNLNGQWGNTNYGQGLNWYSLTGTNHNVLVSEMKIRQSS